MKGRGRKKQRHAAFQIQYNAEHAIKTLVVPSKKTFSVFQTPTMTGKGNFRRLFCTFAFESKSQRQKTKLRKTRTQSGAVAKTAAHRTEARHKMGKKQTWRKITCDILFPLTCLPAPRVGKTFRSSPQRAGKHASS